MIPSDFTRCNHNAGENAEPNILWSIIEQHGPMMTSQLQPSPDLREWLICYLNKFPKAKNEVAPADPRNLATLGAGVDSSPRILSPQLFYLGI